MLLPEYLEAAPEGIVELYSKLDETIIRDIVRRLVKTGGVTLSAAWQAERLQDSGLLYDEIIQQVPKMTDASESQVRALFQDAGIESLKYDFAIYEAAGLTPLPLNQSPAAAQVLRAGIQKTQGYLKNLSLTTAATTQSTYINAVTLAEMQVESGAFDYVTAIRNAIREAALAGTTVLYPTGHIDKLDVAIRRATLTGVSQTAAQISERYANDMDCDLVETTAHPGARPDHQVWQGKVFSRSGSGKYPDFKQSTGYGTGAGLCGWNCRHSFFPFYEGISTSAYPREKLNEYNNRTVTYNHHNISYYDATQMQRNFERHIRATKRELAGYDEGVKATDSEELRNSMKEKFSESSVKLKRQESELKDFLDQTGLDRQGEREQVLGFGRSQAQKAVSVYHKQQAMVQNFTQKMNTAGFNVKGFSSYTGDVRTLDEMQTAFSKMAKLYPEEANGLTIAYSYIKDADTFGEYEAKTKTIRYNRQLYGNYKNLETEYATLVKAGFFPAGTDCRAAFYHEFGHAFGAYHTQDSYRKSVDSVLQSLGYGHLNVAQRKSAIRKELSEYAMENTNPAYQEVIAECFSEWYNSDAPRIFCKTFLKEVGAI